MILGISEDMDKGGGGEAEGKEKERAVESEELLWIPRKGEGERQLTFNEAQWIIGGIVEERGSADPEECHRRLMEAKERFQTILSFTSVLVKVKGGTFQMRCNERCFAPNVRTVTLTYDYWIGKYPVTYHEYDMAVEAAGCYWLDDEGSGRGFRPVEYLDWESAAAYCNWLSRREGLPIAIAQPGGLEGIPDITKVAGYRLPTLAEYENVAQRGLLNSRGYKYAVSGVPYQAGLYTSDAIETEWCYDWWGYDRATVNPTGNHNGEGRGLYDHVLFYPENLTANTTDYLCYCGGFRIARTVIR